MIDLKKERLNFAPIVSGHTAEIDGSSVSLLIGYYIYTVSKKTRHQTLAHNFPKWQPIFKILSLVDSLVNLQLTHI